MPANWSRISEIFGYVRGSSQGRSAADTIERGQWQHLCRHRLSADGTLVMTYLPSTQTITVDMSKLASPASARWFDPTDGSYKAIAGSPFANSRQFRPPANNAAGDGDWVFVLELPARRNSGRSRGFR